MEINLKELLAKAIEFGQLAGNHTLNYFGKAFEIIEKSDASPVTIADREAEQILRSKIEEYFPEHGIIGEEFGIKETGHPVTWVLDPIDGTKSFIHGVPLYTTLIGIMVDSVPVIGLIYAPATGEIAYAAKGLGAFYNHKPTKVRPCTNLSKATFFTTELSHIKAEGYWPFFETIHDQCAYGHMKVAAGQADLMFDPILNIWDAAALLPIIEEAGGIFSDTKGRLSIHGGNGYSCSPELFPIIQNYLDQLAV
jgi:histidinol-phosphatase